MVAGAAGAGVDVVLQPLHHGPVLHRRHQHIQPVGHIGGQAGAQGPADQLGGQHHPPLAERVHGQRPLLGLDPEQEVAGEVDALHAQARAPRGVQVQHAQGHRQAAPPFQHRDQVGVGGVLEGHDVAVQAQVAGHGFGQRLLGRFALQPFGEPVDRVIHKLARRIGVAVGILVQRAEQRRFEQGEAVVLELAQLGESGFGFLARHPSPSTSPRATRREYAVATRRVRALQDPDEH